MTEPPAGRRERKKAATRQSIADAALRLFQERGYDQVSIREIADAADVSTTTLFKHFPGKEALVFDEADDREAALVTAVSEGGRDVLGALRGLFLTERPQMAEFAALIESTPALRNYAERLWTRHAETLGAAIAGQVGVRHDDVACVALARFVLDIPVVTRGRPDRRAAVETIFELLASGWAQHLGS